jgi:hypothetical protein
MDGKISTAGSFRAMYRQYRRAHPCHFSRLRHLGRLQTKINGGLKMRVCGPRWRRR